MSVTVDCLEWQNLSAEDAMQIGELLFAVWPPKNQSDPRPRPQPVANYQGYAGPAKRRPRKFVVRLDGRIVSHASVSAREIEVDGRRYWAQALGGVCTYRHLRNQGFAAAVVRVAFTLVHHGDFELSLFQTPVPAFYEKLGARCIPNRIINSTDADPERCPFWDPYMMVYPAKLVLPPGPIDIRGPAY